MKTLSMTAAVFCAAAVSVEACTSWVIHPDVTGSGMMIVQKVLDQYPRDGKLEAEMRTAPNGWRWMRIGRNNIPNFSMNEKGVVMTTNDGDRVKALLPHDENRYGYGPFQMNMMVAKNCETAAQGVEMLLNIGRNVLTSGTSGIYFVADPRRAFMVNIGNGYAEVSEIENGMVVITNTWRLAGGEEVSLKNFGAGRSDRCREANTRASLRQAQVDGKYTIRGCIDTSRRSCGTNIDELYPFRKGAKVRSLASVCFEIDREFPAYLSCAYIALGPQQHTVYLPAPMALAQFPEKMRRGSWSRIAFDHQEAIGSDHAALPRMRKLEDNFLAEFDAVRDRARQLLREGKISAASQMLNECFDRQYAAASALMDELQAEAAKKKVSEEAKKK